jgi:triosephosphate isomerase
VKIEDRYGLWKIWVNACRFFLAAVFIFSGFTKAVDPLGTQYKIQEYIELFGWSAWVPDYLPLMLAMAQGVVEFTLGSYVLFGIRRRFSSWLMILCMAVFTPLTLWLAVTAPPIDCGCFGEAVTLTNWQTFGKNVLLLIAAWSVHRGYRQITPWVTYRFDWLVALYTLVYAGCLTAYSLRELPLFDFRPYHIGANLRDDRLSPSADPSLLDFFIETPEGEDLTEEVMDREGYTFLLVAHQIQLADDGQIDQINDLYDYCVENGYDFMALTASGEKQIDDWRDHTGAEYPFGQVDDTVLRTMIRSNPGLILLKDGVVVNKWSRYTLPDEADLKGRLEDLPLAHLNVSTYLRKVEMLILWFVGPLLLCLLADVAWEQWRKRAARKKEIKNKLNINPLITNKMRKNIVAGNWKMNKNLQEGIALAKELNEALAADKPNCGVIICTPFIHLASVTPIVDKAVIGVGAENCADKVSGAYTGEVSAEMVASTGAEYVILGHSERRAYYHETVEILEEKVKLALANNLKPIFCIGEVLEEREANKQNEVVAAQLASVFSLSAEDFSKIILAYEPVWAIGTGKTATPAQAQEIHAYIRSLVAEKYGKEVAENTSILYGGSCKPSNAKELFANPDVDGGLIGGAALKVADFKGIIDAFK